MSLYRAKNLVDAIQYRGPEDLDVLRNHFKIPVDKVGQYCSIQSGSGMGSLLIFTGYWLVKDLASTCLTVMTPEAFAQMYEEELVSVP